MTLPTNRIARRHVILGGLALCLARPARAGGGGGGGNDSTAPRKPPTVKTKYSAKEFSRLSAAEIAEINKNITLGKPLTVEGFSQAMSDHLAFMAGLRRRRTQRLIKDMEKITDTKKRVTRLRQEQHRVETELATLLEARKRAQDKGLESAENEANKQINKTKRHLGSVKTWVNHPHEGMR